MRGVKPQNDRNPDGGSMTQRNSSMRADCGYRKTLPRFHSQRRTEATSPPLFKLQRRGFRYASRTNPSVSLASLQD